MMRSISQGRRCEGIWGGLARGNEQSQIPFFSDKPGKRVHYTTNNLLVTPTCPRTQEMDLNTFVASLTNVGRAILAKLHTAVSLSSEYSVISQHKFELLIVPRFF